VKWDCQGRP